MKSDVIEELCIWFNSASTSEVFKHELVARKIKEFGGYDRVTSETLHRTITQCRTEMELRYKTTIVNLRGVGYKLATPQELASTTAKWVKRTVMYADRTYRLVEITDKRLIPGALKKVFSSTEGRIRALSVRGKKFVKSFIDYTKKVEVKELGCHE